MVGIVADPANFFQGRIRIPLFSLIWIRILLIFMLFDVAFAKRSKKLITEIQIVHIICSNPDPVKSCGPCAPGSSTLRENWAGISDSVVFRDSVEFNPDYDREVLPGRCIGGIFLVLLEIWNIISSPSGKAV